MSYYNVSRVGEPVRVPIGPDRTQDEGLNAAETFWAGFNPQEVAQYTVHASYGGAQTAQRLMFIANGGTPTASDKALIAKLSIPLKTPYLVAGVGYMKTPLEIIKQGMAHMAANPKKKGGIGGTIKNIVLNVATGGLYSIGKAAVNIAKGKPILKEAKGALASQGIAGGILTPVVGVDKSLALQAAVATGALAAAAGTGALTGSAAKLAPVALSTATKALTAAPSGDGAPSSAYQEGAPAPYPDGPVTPVQAGMFGNMDPMTIGLLLGVPVVLQLLLKGRK